MGIRLAQSEAAGHHPFMVMPNDAAACPAYNQLLFS